MDKRKFRQGAILLVILIVLSLLLPYIIRFTTSYITKCIIGEAETETQTDSEAESETETEAISERAGTYSIGDPDAYTRGEAVSLQPEAAGSDPELARRYESEAREYADYMASFDPEYTEEENGIMQKFLSGNESGFHDAAAAYAYVQWGKDRRITRLQFCSLSDDSDGTLVCLIEFFHTSHPDTENGAFYFCEYDIENDTYSFS